MARYQVIAKKFRPKTFSEVVGQFHVISTLKNALRLGRVAHAYLFTGCRGTGKTTLVRLFAKAINCHNLSSDYEPCNACPSCNDINSGRSLDILEIDGASNRGIDDIRQINETVGYAASNGGHKIIIIDEVHMLTKEAFNALLKTLEEPPEKVKFFFATTEPHKVIATILSRCQRFDLVRIPLLQILEKLKMITKELEIDITDDALKLISKLAEGSLRDAQSLLDQVACYEEGQITHEAIERMMGLVPLETFAKIDQAYEQDNVNEAFLIASSIFDSGIDIDAFFEMLLDHYRNILLTHYQVKLDTSSLTKEAIELYKRSKSIYTPTTLQAILSQITQALSHSARAALRKIDIEMILLFIMKQKHRLSYDALIDQLKALQEKIGQPSPPKQVTPPPPVEKTPTPLPKVEQAAPKSVDPIQGEQPSFLEKPAQPPIPQAPAPANPQPLKVENSDKNRHDVLLNFAAVELKGKLSH